MDYAKGSCARNFNQSIPKFPNPVKALKEDFLNKNRPPSDGVHYNPAFEDGDDENTDVKQSNGQANSELRSSNESGPDVTSTLVKGPTISDSQTSAKSNESGPDVTSRPCLQRQIQDNRRADEGNHGPFSSNLPSENFRLNSTFLEPNTHANRTDFDGIGAPFQLRPNYRYNGNFGTENTLRELNTHANRTDFDGIGAPFQHRQNYRYNGNFGTENTLRSSRWDSPEHQTFYQEDCLPPRIPTDNSPPPKTEPNTHANRTDYDGIGAPFQPRPNYRHNGNFGIENTFREPNTNANRTDYDGIGAHFQLRPNDRYNGKFGTENTLRLSRRGSRKHQRHLPPRIFTDNSPSPKTGCRFSYKMLVPITLFILIGAVTLLIVLLNVPKEYTNTIAGCSESYVSLGSESYTSCHFGYDVIEIDIIQLKTKHGDINFPNPFKNRTFGNDTETNSTGVITLNDWTLKYRSDDGGTVEIFFLTNITSCDMKGTYEVVTKNRNNETRNYPFEVKIADDYSTQYSIIAYDEGLTSPTLEMRCDGSVSCKDYLFYQASVTKDGKALNENMFCNLNRTKSGKVRTTCTTRMTDPELMKKANTTLYCSPSVPTNINTTVNSSSQEYRPNVLKDLCAARLNAGFGEPLHYYCNKRIHNADENAFPLKIEVLKGQEKIASLTVPKDGTSQKSAMGRYQFEGHLQGNILAININLTMVYHCDDGFYTVKVTNASDIKFELILPDFGSRSNCPKELKIPWQQHMKHNCQFCSERDVALLYDTNGEQTKEIPSSGVQVARTFQNGLVKLDFHIQNMTCDTSFAVLVVADINRTISLTSEASFFGKVEKTFSTQSATENHTMSFTHFLGCYGANILTLVSGPAVIHYTHNKTESKHDGIILQVTVTYQTEYAFNGSLISSVVTYNDLEMKVKRSDDHFVVIHLPASDHRQSTDANPHSVPSSQTPSFLQDDVFPSIFHRALHSSVSIIVDDPIYMNTDFRYLTERATSREVEQILRAVMHKLFLQVGVSVSSALERETLFQHFHRMRCDKSTMTEIQEAFASESTLTNRTVNNFLQILLMELIGQILSECYQQEVKQATDVKESMSQNDRKILYYIAGYIVRSLRKNTNRIHQTDEGVLAALDKMQSDGTTELSTYASWFNQVNRGGLKRPSDTLVDLVCAMEIVVRGKVSFDNLSSTSLLVAPLKEAILESTAVKHYADQIFRGCKFDNSFQVERIAYLFLTIRGFAVVRAKRTQLHASKTNNSKPSFSLRQVLGSKSINIM